MLGKEASVLPQIIRSPRRRRTMAVQVGPTGMVTVHVPRRCSTGEIEDFLAARRNWIERTRARLRTVQARYPQRPLTPGSTIPFLGADYPFDALGLDGSREISHERTAAYVHAWYRAQALPHLTARTYHFANRLGVQPTHIAVRTQRRRWGSCAANGRISYNWRLILCPRDVVDYVVAHEVAHLRHHNHGARFWQTVAAMFADFTAPRRWLQIEGMAYVAVV